MIAKPLIYAVDDELPIRELYTCALESGGYEIECFENANELWQAMEIKLPKLVLLDILLDGIDGYKILETIRNNKKWSRLPVIMVSAKGEEVSKVKGLNLGADDYISKPFGVMELIARVAANLRKHTWQEDSLQYKDITIDDSKHEILVASQQLKLTLREYNLLKFLVQNANVVIKRDDLLNAVWGEEFFGETRALDMHIKEIRRKLCYSQVEIATVRSVGFVLK